jgi:hypothetical protein
MSQWKRGTRRKAIATAALLLLAGGAAGVLIDRLWLLPREAVAMPLTAHAMAARLDLSAADQARVRALLDSMHADMTAAAQQGSDSLLTTARNAHRRIEAALPPDARAEFRAWMHEHHRQLLARIGSGRMHGGHHEDR